MRSTRPSPLTSPAATRDAARETPGRRRRSSASSLRSGAAEHADVRAAARPRPRDDVGAAVAVDVARRHAHAAGERRDRRRRSWPARSSPAPLNTRDVRAAARAGAGDDVGAPVAVDVARRDVHAAGKRRVVGEEAGELASGPAPLNTRTCGPPPGPAPVMMSARPSPLTSPAATCTPPAKRRVVGEEAAPARCKSVPLKTRTCGPPPGPAPVMMSSEPSPLTSPSVTLTPPRNAG